MTQPLPRIQMLALGSATRLPQRPRILYPWLRVGRGIGSFILGAVLALTVPLTSYPGTPATTTHVPDQATPPLDPLPANSSNRKIQDDSEGDFIRDLSSLASFSASFIQTTNVHHASAAPPSSGVFHFDKKRRFKLRYNAPGDSKNTALDPLSQETEPSPLVFVFDGAWLVQRDNDLGQVSYLHKNDFPLSFMVDNPEQVEKQLRNGTLSVTHVPSPPGQRHYKIASPELPEPVVVFFGHHTNSAHGATIPAPLLVLQGWQIQHLDGSLTQVRLQDHRAPSHFPTNFFSVQ